MPLQPLRRDRVEPAMNPIAGRRPAGITALSLFFVAGCLISLTSLVSLTFSWAFLEPIWRLNPKAREAFAAMGSWADLLLAAVSVACGLAAAGLWHGARWGYVLAVGLIAVNLAGDAVNAIVGTEPRAVFGIPVALAILIFLSSRRVRSFFGGFPRPELPPP